MTSIRVLVVGAVLLSACGGAVMGECSRDTDCKGDRVCTLGACVNPGGAGGGTGGGTSGAGGGTSGTGGGTAQPQQCFGGRDSDCPADFWCKAKVCTATTKGKVGEQCSVNGDCAGGACLFRPGDVLGYCSKVCQSFGECPAFWDCKNIANGASTYCVQS